MTTPLTAQDPAALYRHLPDVYSRDRESDNFKLLAGFAEGLQPLDDGAVDFRDDRFADTATGTGLDRKGGNFSIDRFPGMTDVFYRDCIQGLAGLKRGTLGAIRKMWDITTGLTTATIEDRQTNGAIPFFEVHISVATPTNSLGRGAYAGITVNFDGRPLESAIAGQPIAATGFYGGLFNDHAWSPVDFFTRGLLELVRPIGVKILYFEV